MDAGEFNGRMLYTGLKLDYRLRLWAPTSASRAISAVAQLLVCELVRVGLYGTQRCVKLSVYFRRYFILTYNKLITFTLRKAVYA